MRQPNRRPEPGRYDTTTVLVGIFLGLILGVVAVLWAEVSLGSLIDGVNSNLTDNPLEMVFGLIRGRLTWPGSSIWLTALFGAVVVAIIVGLAVLIGRRRSRRTRVDHAVPFLARGRDLVELGRTGATRTAHRLGVTGGPGRDPTRTDGSRREAAVRAVGIRDDRFGRPSGRQNHLTRYPRGA